MPMQSCDPASHKHLHRCSEVDEHDRVTIDSIADSTSMQAQDGFKNKSLRVTQADVQLSSPAIDTLALSALNPEVGHSFLDVGSGSGYLTMLASHMVAYSGTAVGVDVSPTPTGHPWK